MPNAIIDDIEFTLFYSFDQLGDEKKLSKLSDLGKIVWLEQRMQMVFIEPLNRLLDRNSVAWKTLNSNGDEEEPRRTVDLATFSILLNGVEALGSFLRPPDKKNKDNFMAFMFNYMSDWTVEVDAREGKKKLSELLWKHFRSGIAHAFVIELGGIEFGLLNKWEIQNGLIAVNPKLFYDDFLIGQTKYFEDVKDPINPNHKIFLTRFLNAYPH